MTRRPSPVVVGLAGGTASGKTTLAAQVADAVGPGRTVRMELDRYYRPIAWSEERRPSDHNFDHPDAFDVDLLVDQLEALRRGVAIDAPVYDFETHTRRAEPERLDPSDLVVVEGTLVLGWPALRERFDLSVFLDVPADTRFIRRLRRDLAERGRTVDSIVTQYLRTVRPMHDRFVGPSRAHADVVVQGETVDRESWGSVVRRIETLCDERRSP